MPVLKKGSLSLNLGFVRIGGDLDETDRQAAWALYCELVSRRAVTGLVEDDADSFQGEVMIESLASLHAFFGRARQIMIDFPVGQIPSGKQQHLGFFIMQLLEGVVRPFLERWQAHYRHWHAGASQSGGSPFDVQAKFGHLVQMQADWSVVRQFCRDTARELIDAYKLIDVEATIPSELRAAWSTPIER